jgi:DNA-binding response OmpR family regulator
VERPARLDGQAVLIADDDAALRQLSCVGIVAAGGEAFEAADGREAVRVLERTGIDLAVVDIFMPERDGVETITEAKRRWPRLKIIAISGVCDYRGLDVLHMAQSVGADLVLPKPFGLNDLLEHIARLLDAGRPG